MLNKKIQKYLKAVFGYNKVSEIDNLTIECIKENIGYEEYKRQYFYDREILKEYNKRRNKK